MYKPKPFFLTTNPNMLRPQSFAATGCLDDLIVAVQIRLQTRLRRVPSSAHYFPAMLWSPATADNNEENSSSWLKSLFECV